MKLTIEQIVLESVAFGHPSNYLSVAPKDGGVHGKVALAIDLLKAGESGANIVRLRVNCAEPTPYPFAITYIVILMVDFEGNAPPTDLEKRIAVTGCNMLYPFARETLATLSSKGRFGTTWLNPIDFNSVVQAMTFENIPASELSVAAKP